ncbi:MAG TPA: ATP-binding protein [Terracidiphilus sp.]
MKRILVSWSSGKDCAWALHLLRQRSDIEIVGLLTTINAKFDRVAMHGTRRAILETQASAAQLSLWSIPLPWPCSNEIYEQRMADACHRALAERVDAIAFGDLFLRDVRSYRENQLKSTGIEPLFPLWDIPTADLARDMIAGGLRAKLVCVDSRQLDPSFAGREFDDALLRDLPPGVDPCGENGEFHSFVFDGPMFLHPIALQAGEIVNRDGFIYADFKASETCIDVAYLVPEFH